MSVFKANSNACEESLIWLCNCNRRLWTRLKNRDKRKWWGFERRPLYIHGHTIERLRRRQESQHKTVFRRRHDKRQRGHCSSQHMAAALASPPCESLQAQWIYSSLTRACSVVSWGTFLVRASVLLPSVPRISLASSVGAGSDDNVFLLMLLLPSSYP